MADTKADESDMAVSHSGSTSGLKNLFPTKIHFVIFVGYMALFVNQGEEHASVQFALVYPCVYIIIFLVYHSISAFFSASRDPRHSIKG